MWSDCLYDSRPEGTAVSSMLSCKLSSKSGRVVGQWSVTMLTHENQKVSFAMVLLALFVVSVGKYPRKYLK